MLPPKRYDRVKQGIRDRKEKERAKQRLAEAAKLLEEMKALRERIAPQKRNTGDPDAAA